MEDLALCSGVMESGLGLTVPFGSFERVPHFRVHHHRHLLNHGMDPSLKVQGPDLDERVHFKVTESIEDGTSDLYQTRNLADDLLDEIRIRTKLEQAHLSHLPPVQTHPIPGISGSVEFLQKQFIMAESGLPFYVSN